MVYAQIDWQHDSEAERIGAVCLAARQEGERDPARLTDDALKGVIPAAARSSLLPGVVERATPFMPKRGHCPRNYPQPRWLGRAANTVAFSCEYWGVIARAERRNL